MMRLLNQGWARAMVITGLLSVGIATGFACFLLSKFAGTLDERTGFAHAPSMLRAFCT